VRAGALGEESGGPDPELRDAVAAQLTLLSAGYPASVLPRWGGGGGGGGGAGGSLVARGVEGTGILPVGALEAAEKRADGLLDSMSRGEPGARAPPRPPSRRPAAPAAARPTAPPRPARPAARKQSVVEVIGRKRLAAVEAGEGGARGGVAGEAGEGGAAAPGGGPAPAPAPALASPAQRILEAVVGMPEEEWPLVLPDAFTPPGAGEGAAPRGGEDLLWTTPLGLLHAIDLEAQRCRGEGPGVARPGRELAGGREADAAARERARRLGALREAVEPYAEAYMGRGGGLGGG